jgi:spore coat polysaccharide biosynthesis protein SpsF
MFTAIGVVQARLGSDPFKGLVTRRLGGKPLLEWVVRRATDCQRLSQVVVVTGNQPEDELLAESVPPDVPVLAAEGADNLHRIVSVLDHYPADALVRIRPDAPFVDPVLIDRLVNTAAEHPECDYIGYCSRDGRPAILSSVGLFAECCQAEALRRAAREATDPADRRQITRYLYSHPEKFTIRLIPAPAGLDRDDVRLTIDTDEDWEHAQMILEALGTEALDWQRIAGLLDQQPALRKRMASLNHRLAKV